MKISVILSVIAAAATLLSGCGNDTTANKTKTNDTTASAPKSADELFDAKYLQNVRTVTKVPSLEMEIYRKSARKVLAQLESGGAVEAAKAQGISQDDYKKMAVEGLIKDLQGNMRKMVREVSGEIQQKVAMQQMIMWL